MRAVLSLEFCQYLLLILSEYWNVEEGRVWGNKFKFSLVLMELELRKSLLFEIPVSIFELRMCQYVFLFEAQVVSILDLHSFLMQGIMVSNF
jgi:hypothetical protein